MYLEDKIDKLFEMYPKSFNSKSEILLKMLSKNENKINYENLSYKILLPEGIFHEISFLREYGSLYSLLENLVTRKTTVNSANVDQISFIINLMHGYNDWDFDKKTQIDLEKGRSHNIALARANDIFLDTKIYSNKGIKSFLPNKFKEYISQEQKGVFINAMNPYNDRNKIIKLFKDKNILLVLIMHLMQNLSQNNLIEQNNQNRNLMKVQEKE